MDLNTPAGFTGFGPALYRFFDALEEHQNRDWFAANRDTYDTEVREPLTRLVTSLTLAFAALDIPLRADPKTSIFRINRDVRFSKNKHPYKTHASAVWTRDGTKAAQGLFYFQIGIGRTFCAAGFHTPEPDQLQAIRTAIAAKPGAWLDLEARLAAKGLPLSTDHTLTRLPRGFDPEQVAPVAHAVRYTSFVVSRPLGDDDTRGPELIDALVTAAHDSLPLLEFGWAALATLPPRHK